MAVTSQHRSGIHALQFYNYNLFCTTGFIFLLFYELYAHHFKLYWLSLL